MNEEEISTEERLNAALELYKHDSLEWDPDVLLDELERLYKWREIINVLIIRFKQDISKALEG